MKNYYTAYKFFGAPSHISGLGEDQDKIKTKLACDHEETMIMVQLC